MFIKYKSLHNTHSVAFLRLASPLDNSGQEDSDGGR